MNGIILINKEKEYTSHDVVAIVKKITKSKVGHTGTLDPNATGVLPLLLGEATKISKYLINHNKTYEVVIKLGEKTTTADSEGKIIEQKEVPENIFDKNNANNIKDRALDYVQSVLNTFLGKSKQIPPMYSAIKVKGKKLYNYARQGIEIKVEPREIEIYSIKLNSKNQEQNEISFTVECSKGTYIRSLCEDIATKLGTVGFMKELKRTKVGEFSIENAVTLNEFKQKIENGKLSDIITIEKIFKNQPEIELSQNYIKKYINGVALDLKKVKSLENTNYQDGTYRIYINKKFIGLGIVKNNSLKRDLYLNESDS